LQADRTILESRAEDLFRAAVEAVEPSRLVVRAIAALPTAIHAALERRQGRLVAVGAGKAVRAMARALEDALGEPPGPLSGARARQEPPPPMSGIVVAKRGAGGPALRRIRVVEASHPVPDEAGVAAAGEVLDLVARLGPADVLFVLLSGGASALLAAPAAGLSLEDLRATTALLLAGGVPIDEMNAVRKHLSRIAGGRLAQASRAAALLGFAISDVPGDRLDTIASGPTVPDPTTYALALAVLERHGLLAKAPPAVRVHLERGAQGKLAETAKPGDPAFERARTTVIGSNRTALEAAAKLAETLGYRTLVLPDALRGAAREAGRVLAARLDDARRRGQAPLCLLAGGETTVEVRGPGRGGRCQELAIGAALALDGVPNAALLAAGTDGEDGPTDAAGAVVSGTTAAAARRAGVDLEAALAANDSYAALERLGALVRTGPTGTNVMDVAVGIVEG
jgi:glycerate 2-kinase